MRHNATPPAGAFPRARAWCLPASPPSDCASSGGTAGVHSPLCHSHSRRAITLAALRNATCDVGAPSSFGEANSLRLQVLRGSLFVVASPHHARMHASSRGAARVLLANLAAALRLAPPRDLELLLCPSDAPAAWPALSQGVLSSAPPAARPFLIPHGVRSRAFSPRQWLRADDFLRPPPPAAEWAAARAAAAWRGANTGYPPTTAAAWHANPRARLAVLSRMYPRLLDAAISAWPQPHDELRALTPFLRAAPREGEAFLRAHRYLVDVDGNAQSNRFPALLRLGRLVLKASRHDTFLSATQRAGRLPHALPLREDLSDLVPTVRCLRRHDRAAHHLAVEGNAAAAQLLSYAATIGYWADLLHHYAERQTFTPQRLPGATHWLLWGGSW
ncbi:hypothetical protein AB1Y20_011459 [Prymnesium parvum]|uniref:Glycosyl transferase CAP10 domain-containing protein n=1 Tax=Prymnesium parvum TaxID=97485 RepID=A0AB34IQL3_PRYPA